MRTRSKKGILRLVINDYIHTERYCYSNNHAAIMNDLLNVVTVHLYVLKKPLYKNLLTVHSDDGN